ncbi:Glycoside hydrolase family 20, catalytic domain [Sesbania bispinosa]|nr:Glycoside hydrolase family 20, catalytic domain [Sesbania bispinosa]
MGCSFGTPTWLTLFLIAFAFCISQAVGVTTSQPHQSLPFIWPLPAKFSFGNESLSLDPALSLSGNGTSSAIVRAAFDKYKGIVFKHGDRFGFLRTVKTVYDVTKFNINVHSKNEELQLGVDESYNLFVAKDKVHSGAGQVTIEANTVYGALRGLENVLHWHIIDEESFPLEVPTYPNLWKGIHVMPELDVPGHAESWGIGYPEVWPSRSCREPLDVSKKFTFDVLTGILTDMRKIFPFELVHLGGDEVHTDCWTNTSHVKKWLMDHNLTTEDAYQYFVLKAQNIALLKNWSPVNWEETFNTFPSKLHPRTVVHNWLGPGVCPKVVAKGLRCIFSNQGVWYLDHLDVPWDVVYNAEPLEGIRKESEQKLVLGGEVCMWERLWSERHYTSKGNVNSTALPRLQYFRCLLNRRGVPAAPVTNFYARTAPIGPGSCFHQ